MAQTIDQTDIDRLHGNYDQAMKKVAAGGKGLTVREGGVGADAALGQAYQVLVRHGLAPQIGRKYRRGGKGGARK